MMNPCLNIMGNQSTDIKDILTELKRGKRSLIVKKPVTKNMVNYVISKEKSLYKDKPNNIYTQL